MKTQNYNNPKKYCVVHVGARDHYQLAQALNEKEMLARLLTDFYTPDFLIRLAGNQLPKLYARYNKNLSSKLVHNNLFSKIYIESNAYLTGKSNFHKNKILDRYFSKQALYYVKKNAISGIVCYSYYWSVVADAIANNKWDGQAVVFQVHPVAQQIKQILRYDREATGLSYLPEAEERSPEKQDTDYISSLKYATTIITASTFTKNGMSEQGVPAEKITVIPYGCDISDMSPVQCAPAIVNRQSEQSLPLKLLWVGQLAYRKAPHHLFNAVKHFSKKYVQLSVITRSSIPDELSKLIPENVTVYNSVSNQQREEMYRTHHLFVMPSLVEGFGLVYLEALGQGLPILCTSNTGGADIISHGHEGFIVPHGNVNAIQECIQICLDDRKLLFQMSMAAYMRAKQWSWEQFRKELQITLA